VFSQNADPQADGREDERQDHGVLRESLPAGDRAQALLRVHAVAFVVGDVVDQVDGAGDEAECPENRQRLEAVSRVRQVAGEDQRRENEDVLDPLVGTEGAQVMHCGGMVAHFWLALEPSR
jgi:hypothetical protein